MKQAAIALVSRSASRHPPPLRPFVAGSCDCGKRVEGGLTVCLYAAGRVLVTLVLTEPLMRECVARETEAYVTFVGAYRSYSHGFAV